MDACKQARRRRKVSELSVTGNEEARSAKVKSENLKERKKVKM
jgi:hypothetical protein